MTVIEITPFGPGDNDGQRTASVLAAYFNMERTRAFRRLVWRRLAPPAGVTWLVAAVTTLLSADTFLIVLLVCALVAGAVAVVEWRAKQVLRGLVASVTEPTAPTTAD